jgi:5-methylcytosine-specific restriction protein A
MHQLQGGSESVCRQKHVQKNTGGGVVKTFLFVTKPTENPEQVKANGGIPWCCCEAIRSSNRILVYVTGGKGICYEWRAVSNSIRDPDGQYAFVCNVEFVSEFIPPITRQELCDAISRDEWVPPHLNFRGNHAVSIPDNVLTKIRALRPMRSLQEVEQKFSEDVAASLKLPASERLKHLASAPKIPAKFKVTTEVFNRSPHVVAAVLDRADGHCECCKSAAPFKRAVNGKPYLEVHHKKWLSKGGEDTIENAVALCPNCHRKAHHG